ncbi:MAG: RluA family pseudouridine synthase [Oscillospiraceae bacterium]
MKVLIIKQFTAAANDVGVRISRFVENVTKNMPSSLLHKGFRNKRIKINNKAVKEDYRICENDLIELYINDEFFSLENTLETETVNNNLPKPDIIFEDENLLIVNKPMRQLCHSDVTNDITLIDIVKNYLTQKGEYNKSTENTFSPALCNRLDRGTSGLVICAKNYPALRDMNAIISNNLLTKQYQCVCIGTPKNSVYTAFHKRDLTSKTVTISANEKDDFKPIKTGITVLDEKSGFSLCKIDLFTGKTHQIRAHLAFLNHPLLGDKKYGNDTINEKYPFQNQVLCAYRLIFGKISKDNVLSYLSGKKITLENPAPKKIFENLK